MNKRVLCIILCMTMCISTILPCFADDGSKTDFTVAEKIADYLFNLPKEDMKSFLSNPRVYVKTDDQLKSLLNE